MAAETKIKVLIVDDTPETRVMIQRMVQFDASVEVVGQAKTGREAIDMAGKLLPDVCLMDINMPDVDGYTLTQQIKAMPDFHSTPIIAITANVMRGDREKTLQAGCDGYIEKPIDVDRFLEMIASYL